jgi:DASS family divalent anion:Na+ symporter
MAHAALTAVAVMVVTGVLKWDEVLCNEDGWDTIVWLGGLVSMAGTLLKPRAAYSSVHSAAC